MAQTPVVTNWINAKRFFLLIAFVLFVIAAYLSHSLTDGGLALLALAFLI